MLRRTGILLRFLAMAAILSMPLKLALAGTETAIVIGHAIDLSGPNGSIGRDYVAGITTYFDSVNVKGGINGRQVRYLVRDDHGEPAESVRLVGELIKQDHAAYLLGGIGVEVTRAIVASPAFENSDLVLFAPLSDSLNIARARAMFWRPSLEQELQFILSYFERLGIKDVGIAYQESPLNHDAYRSVVSQLRRRGMTLSGTAKLASSPAELEKEAANLSRKRPAMVIAIADTISTALFLKAFRKHEPVVFVAGTSLINLATLAEIAGSKATEWAVFSQVVPDPASSSSAIQSEHIAMMKKFRDEPVSSITLEGFAVGKTLSKAIQMDRSSRGRLQQFVAHKSAIDLGGLTVSSSGQQKNMSEYVNIALFKKGGLLY